MSYLFNLQGRLGNHFFIISAIIYLMNKYNVTNIKLDILSYVYYITNFNSEYPKYIQYFIDNNYLLNDKDKKNKENILKNGNYIQIDDYFDINDIEIIRNIDDSIKTHSNQNLYFNCTMFQNKKYFFTNKEKIKSLFTIENDNTNYYKKQINENDVFISVRRGDYFDAKFYVLNPLYYIDSYNKYFSGKNIYISSDDIKWCKENLTINKFVNCKNIIYIENLSPLEIVTISQYFNNYICANSTFSMMCNLFSNDENPNCVCVRNISHNIIRDDVWTNNAIIIDIEQKNYQQYIDILSLDDKKKQKLKLLN